MIKTVTDLNESHPEIIWKIPAILIIAMSPFAKLECGEYTNREIMIFYTFNFVIFSKK